MSIAINTMNAFIAKLQPTSIAFAGGTEEASAVIESRPLPTTRDEAWKYTRVAKIGKIGFTHSSTSIESAAPYTIDSSAHTLVFVNGQFQEHLSSQGSVENVQLTLLSNLASVESEAPIEDELFNAVNVAYLNDGILIEVADKSQIEKPIQILHILKGNEVLSNFRILIKTGKFSKASVVEGFFSEDGSSSFCNTVSEVSVGENAHLTIEKVQYEDQGNFHISTEEVKQAKDSTFTINTMTLNGGLVRNNLNIAVNGQNCTTNLNGAYLLNGKQHVDNHSVVDHKVANCDSNELYKGVIDEKATAVFNGKVYVRQDAQVINAFQSNGNVLLSDDASVNSKPELEIYADDVKCSHGSTTGQLDEEAVFYLRARGISEKAARQLMVSAFIGEVLEKIESDAVSAFVNQKLTERFGWEF